MPRHRRDYAKERGYIYSHTEFEVEGTLYSRNIVDGSGRSAQALDAKCVNRKATRGPCRPTPGSSSCHKCSEPPVLMCVYNAPAEIDSIASTIPVNIPMKLDLQTMRWYRTDDGPGSPPQSPLARMQIPLRWPQKDPAALSPDAEKPSDEEANAGSRYGTPSLDMQVPAPSTVPEVSQVGTLRASTDFQAPTDGRDTLSTGHRGPDDQSHDEECTTRVEKPPLVRSPGSDWHSSSKEWPDVTRSVVGGHGTPLSKGLAGPLTDPSGLYSFHATGHEDFSAVASPGPLPDDHPLHPLNW